MIASLDLLKTKDKTENQIFILSAKSQLTNLVEDETTANYLNEKLKETGSIAALISPEKTQFFLLISEENNLVQREKARRKGQELYELLKKEGLKKVVVSGSGVPEVLFLDVVEGLVLSSYQFLKYKTDKSGYKLEKVKIQHPKVSKEAVKKLENIAEAVTIARNLVNEPVVFLTAKELGKAFESLGKLAGFEVDVLGKSKIEALKMGGLLAVNIGAPNPPTFSIMEYKPQKARNKKPIVLVGKGVVYDTGGLSLKPTPGSMDAMKCDMAGAAAVAGTLAALAWNKIPLHVIGLVPATENRPDGNAITPGDVITMMSGKTVEILNTDAEGRLILGDALHYAKKYKPELVIDLATLTGAAARAIGKEGIVYMGNADKATKASLEKAGLEVQERLVEFPLWPEYEQYMKSHIADLKNIGGADAGAITAGIFLQHFVDFPWLHLDIAGGAFLDSNDGYRPKGGTGIGVRLLFEFLSNYSSQ